MNSPKQIAENYLNVGENKINNKWYNTFVLAILAGMFIALAGVASALASRAVPSEFANLVKSMVFPLGLALVILCGSELFTGNCLLIIPLINKRIPWGKTLLNYLVVYVGNLVGSVIVAFAVSVTKGFNNAGYAESVVATAVNKVSIPFGNALVLGIMCNILVCLAVWIAMSSNTAGGKLALLYMPIMAFVVCGFEHSVANMYYLSAGILTSAFAGIDAPDLTVGSALINNLLPVTLGNVIGGMLFVGVPYWFVYVRKDDTTATK